MFSFLTNKDVMALAAVWLGAICTLGLYSILFRENKLYRFFEHLFLGLAIGYTVYTTWNDTLKPRWWVPMTADGKWWWAFAFPAGLLFYMIYSRKYNWMSRLIFAIFFGFAAGQQFQGFAAYYFPLFRSAINLPILHTREATAAGHYWLTPWSAAINNILFLVILLCVMSYFFFSFEQKNPGVKVASRFGRYVLMFAFGAIFGSTIMARMSLLIGRVYFLLHDWLHIAH